MNYSLEIKEIYATSLAAYCQAPHSNAQTKACQKATIYPPLFMRLSKEENK